MSTVVARDRFDESVTPAVRLRAIAVGRKARGAASRASAVRYLPEWESLLISFADQAAIVLPVKNYPELAELSEAERQHLTLGFAGSALCLEEKDLHVSIAGMVAASKPLLTLAAGIVASRNGSRSSEAKASASRENGLKGGRPPRARTPG